MTTAVAEPEVEMKEVSLMRIEDENSHLPEPLIQDATVKLSSVFINQRPHMLTGEGPNGEDWEAIISDVIGVSQDAQEFEERKRRFWQELDIDVPSGGQTLQVGTDEDGNPYNPEDHLQYHWARTHPQVAETREEANAQRNKRFWIHDPERETKREADEVETKMEAQKQLQFAREDDEKMDLLVRVLTEKRPDNLTREEKLTTLFQQAQSDPEKFVSAATDENLEIRSEILDALQYEVIRKVGQQYIYNDETIGDSEREVIAWWKNKRNSSVVADIRAKIDEHKR